MAYSFLAFIDESGDDGFGKFRRSGSNGGSSRWLVISALVLRQSHGLEAVRWRDEISAQMPERKSREIHFKHLNHGQRVVAAQALAAKPVCIVSVLAAKEWLYAEHYTGKNRLYFHAARYLIERVSWLCRDLRPSVPEGDGRVAITFSRRGGMSYSEFQRYLRRLEQDRKGDAQIHWPVVDIDAVTALDHSRSASLQLADAAASALAASVEPDRYGNCELRYAKLLRPVTYHRNSNYLTYGITLLPRPEDCHLDQQQQAALSIWK